MSTSAIETPIEMLVSTLQEGAVELEEQIIPDKQGQSDQGSAKYEIVSDTASDTVKLERLIKRKQYWAFLEGRDAALYLRLSSVPVTVERPIDIPSLLSKLSSLLPGGRQLERRARKLAWYLSKGRHVKCQWDNISLSELTPAESSMPDDEFLALYPDQVRIPSRKGGRPRKYRTAKAQRSGHADRQRRYRERKVIVVADVTKTTLQSADR
jgi:hypothetical protein